MPNPIQKIYEALKPLQQELGLDILEVDVPAGPSGHWFLDIGKAAKFWVVEWRPEHPEILNLEDGSAGEDLAGPIIGFETAEQVTEWVTKVVGAK